MRRLGSVNTQAQTVLRPYCASIFSVPFRSLPECSGFSSIPAKFCSWLTILEDENKLANIISNMLNLFFQVVLPVGAEVAVSISVFSFRFRFQFPFPAFPYAQTEGWVMSKCTQDSQKGCLLYLIMPKNTIFSPSPKIKICTLSKAPPPV